MSKNKLVRLINGLMVLQHWWLFAAFIGPFLLSFYPLWQIQARMPICAAIRSGVLGLMLALSICWLGKIEAGFNKNAKPDSKSDRIILAFGVLLWLVWFSTCQMILIAHDEVSQGY